LDRLDDSLPHEDILHDLLTVYSCVRVSMRLKDGNRCPIDREDPEGDFAMAAQLMKLNARWADPREGSRLDAGPIDTASTREQAQRCCPRCGGFLVDERCLDLYDGRIVRRLDRCIQCGNLEDALLLQNRVRISTKSCRSLKKRLPRANRKRKWDAIWKEAEGSS
jgi:hypothetical protein